MAKCASSLASPLHRQRWRVRDQQRFQCEITIANLTFLFLNIFICLAVLGLSCGMQDLVPWPGIELRPRAMEGCSLNHLTTSKVPIWLFKKTYFLFVIWLHQVLVAACTIFDLHCGMQILSCGMWDLVPWPGIKPRPPALGAWSLSYWTTREVSCTYLFKLQFYPDVCPGVGWLDHVATLFLVSWGTSIVFP